MLSLTIHLRCKVCILLAILLLLRVRLLATWKMIEKTNDLFEKLENKLRHVVRWPPSHAHFYEYMSSILLDFCGNFFFLTPKENFSMEKAKK